MAKRVAKIPKWKSTKATAAASFLLLMEASAPLVNALSVPLMELLWEQCLLFHHASSPLYRAEQLQSASRKAAVFHALDFSDGCEATRNALSVA